MTKKEIVSLSLKLAGIYCLIMAIPYTRFAIRMFTDWEKGFSHNLILLNPLVLLLLFGFYLLFSNKLPSKMASSMMPEEKVTSFTFQNIQVLAFSIIGVWLLASALPILPQHIVGMIVLSSTSRQSNYVFPDYFFIFQTVVVVLKLALGVYLFLGGKGLAKLWQKFHSTQYIQPSN